jgi:hypothetical protein
MWSFGTDAVLGTNRVYGNICRIPSWVEIDESYADEQEAEAPGRRACVSGIDGGREYRI